MDLSKAQVTVTLEAIDDLRTQVRTAEARAAALEQERNVALAADPTGRVPELLKAVRAALPIVQFAVGNLDPATVRGWPRASLVTLAEQLGKLADLTPTEKECVNEFQSFVRRIDEIEEIRARRTLPSPA